MDEELKRFTHIKPKIFLAYADSINIFTNNKERFMHKKCIYTADEATVTIYEKLDSDSNIYDYVSIYFKSQIIKISAIGMNNKRILVDFDEMGRVVEVNQNDNGMGTTTD